MDEMVLLKDLPRTLIESVIQELASHTIAFLRVYDATTPHQADLLGSGVLVSAGDRHAILTADHVVQILPTTGRIGLFLERTSQVHTIDTGGISTIRIARGTDDSLGSDLAAIILAPHIAGAIAAKKLFFNLASRRDRMLKDAPDLRNGAWFAQGFLEERTVVAPDPVEEGLTKYFYNFTGVGGPETVENVGDYDYFDFPVSYEARCEAPVSWGGMSGGGIWQVPLKKSNGNLTHLSPVLSGVMFYQHPTTETECGIRGHGRRSIYEKAHRAICEL